MHIINAVGCPYAIENTHLEPWLCFQEIYHQQNGWVFMREATQYAAELSLDNVVPSQTQIYAYNHGLKSSDPTLIIANNESCTPCNLPEKAKGFARVTSMLKTKEALPNPLHWQLSALKQGQDIEWMEHKNKHKLCVPAQQIQVALYADHQCHVVMGYVVAIHIDFESGQLKVVRAAPLAQAEHVKLSLKPLESSHENTKHQAA